MNRNGNRRLSFAAVVLFAATLAPSPADAQESEAIAEGARVYGAMCGRCHNPRSPLERSDRDWVTIINHMRVRANMTGDQVRSVLAFLQATNTDPREPAMVTESREAAPVRSPQAMGAPSRDPQMIARGRDLVGQRACLGCHIIGRQGGQVGPTLNGIAKRRDADYLRRKLADPTVDNATSMMPNFGLSDDEIEAILAYLASLNGP